MFFHTSYYINHFEDINLSCTDKNNDDLKKELSSINVNYGQKLFQFILF